MTPYVKHRWTTSGFAMALVSGTLHSQAIVSKPQPVTPWRQMAVHFSNEKPVSGFPPGTSRSRPHCATDGVTFFDVHNDLPASTVPMVYSATSSGEVRGFPRKTPTGFNSISIRDFFAGDSTLVTLLQAEKRDDDGTLRDTEYFLSTSDHDGDHADLERLDVRFKPLKVSVFGTGNFLVLGWDPSNLMPILALLKEDGTVRRFLDLSKGKGGEAGMLSIDPAQADAAFKTLQGAAFVPFGRDVLLSYPGTANPMHDLDEMGEIRSIPLGLPGGYVLRDVINSGAGRDLVVRAQVKDYSPPADPLPMDETTAVYPEQRLFAIDANRGSVIKEFLFDKPNIMAMTCAVNNHLTAIFPDTVADQAAPASSDGKTVGTDGQAKSQPAVFHLVTSTIWR